MRNDSPSNFGESARLVWQKTCQGKLHLGSHAPANVAAFDTDANAIGFLSIKQHSNVAVEAYVLGVLPNKHRQGIGRSLFACAERHLIDKGV
ncbi:GNAT family N-acetyltransferase [Rhizobium rhizogenes]|uniref:GNAT family N-acetyltransferase n=1 Tax=Rhizobium rhizogenes TaxID=359 RepID=UPI00386E74E9